MNGKEIIKEGKASLGIEFGSTRIKSVLVGEGGQVLASGGYSWENSFTDGYWTYSLDEVKKGLSQSFDTLREDVAEKYGEKLVKVGSIGISAMMHGYLAFDKDEKLLVPFRTWRNTTTKTASHKLTEAFGFNIPQRWSVAHLYEAILNKEPHIDKIAHITTLAGYVHFLLTGEKVLGIGDASGMFPIDSEKKCYDERMLAIFDEMSKANGFNQNIRELLPKVLLCGERAGVLTKEGAALLDKTNELQSGAVFCAPEGDAGTGMVATNSVRSGLGNVSAGTSIFSMVVLEKSLSKPLPELDMVTTPDGLPVAMVHCNNCTSDINAWAEMLCSFLKRMGVEKTMGEVLTELFVAGKDASDDCGGVVSVNYLSGEHLTGAKKGGTVLARKENADFTFENFARANLYSAFSTLKLGMELLDGEKIAITRLMGHGGFFKTENIGAELMASALGVPVTTMTTAGEGGAWGIALLALYAQGGAKKPLADFLDEEVFSNSKTHTENPDASKADGFSKYMDNYHAALKAQKAFTE